MARRRSADSGDIREDDDPSLSGGGGFGSIFDNGRGFSDMGPNIGSIVEPVPQLPDLPAIAGNETTARELGGSLFPNRLRPVRQTPSVDQPQAPPTPSGLPIGMTVQDGEDTMSTPMMSRAPNPIAAMTPNPVAQQATTRRVAPSQLFSDDYGTPMFGRAGGLMGGGQGVMESNDGAPSPTEMMKRLLQMFRGEA